MNSIKNRLTLLLACGLIGVMALVGFTVYKYEQFMLVNSQLSQNTHNIQNSALKTQIFFKTQIQEWKNILLRGYDDNLYNKYLTRFNNSEKKTSVELQKLLLLTSQYPLITKDVKMFISEHKRLGRRYKEALPVYKLSTNSPHITTDKYVRGIDRKPIKILANIVKNTDVIYKTSIEKKEQELIQLKYSLLFIFLISSGIFIIFFWVFIKKGISQPLVNISTLLKSIAEGNKNLTQRLTPGKLTELNLVANWFNEFISNIQEFMLQINKAANNLSDASYQSAKINEKTNQAIIGQQSSVSLVSSSMQKISTNIREVAENAQLTSRSTQSALSSASNASDVVNDAITNINLLSMKIDSSTEHVKHLALVGTEINSILDIISTIANQTNLLALNAAIEAARAGENGRGFAVVANEVRDLSQQTHLATTQIQQLINNMQGRSENAINAMLESKTQALRTVELTSNTGSSIKEINKILATIDVMNKDIADSCTRQSASTNDINKTIININNSIANTINDAQTNTSNSSDLAQLASLLHSLITQFKVSEENADFQIARKQEDNIELF